MSGYKGDAAKIFAKAPQLVTGHQVEVHNDGMGPRFADFFANFRGGMGDHYLAKAAFESGQQLVGEGWFSLREN